MASTNDDDIKRSDGLLEGALLVGWEQVVLDLVRDGGEASEVAITV